jgi:hypothetical protein
MKRYRGKGHSVFFKFHALKYMYEKKAVRRALAVVSRVRKETENFEASILLNLRLSHKIVASKNKRYFLELNAEDYVELLEKGITEGSRRELYKLKNEQLEAVENVKPEDYSK